MTGKTDWAGYLRVHSDRRNLVIHAIAVPLFAGSFAVFVTAVLFGAFADAGIALLLALTGMVLQGRGHKFESHPPEPFSGPGNFLKRWFTEQFVTFPLFVVSGRWWRQFKADNGGSGRAA